MRGPFELIGDVYDYYYNYVRYYAHRRLIFSEYSWEQFYKDTHFSIFRNNDYENVGSLVKQTTLTGFCIGAGIAPLNFAFMRELNKISVKKALPVALGIVLVGTGAGLTYGITVNAAARFRDNKNGPANHAIAAFTSIPILGVYAKRNRLYWGFWCAFWISGLVAFLKLSAMRKIDPLGRKTDELPLNLSPSLSPLQWKP